MRRLPFEIGWLRKGLIDKVTLAQRPEVGERLGPVREEPPGTGDGNRDGRNDIPCVLSPSCPVMAGLELPSACVSTAGPLLEPVLETLQQRPNRNKQGLTHLGLPKLFCCSGNSHSFSSFLIFSNISNI